MAQEKGLARILLVDFRDFTRDRHRTVDDRPYGGGPGMVLKPEPVIECVEWLERRHGRFRKLLMCPTGTPFRQSRAEALAGEDRILLLAGRYEGFDARIQKELELEAISLGDFVLAGGEIPALAILEAVVRLVPGVLGDERSALEDSFRGHGDGDGGGTLDHPHYTRPRVFRGEAVPEVLLSGDHEAIRSWRERAAADVTRTSRPDLMQQRDPMKQPDVKEHRDLMKRHSGGTGEPRAGADPRTNPNKNTGEPDGLPRNEPTEVPRATCD